MDLPLFPSYQLELTGHVPKKTLSQASRRLWEMEVLRNRERKNPGKYFLGAPQS